MMVIICNQELNGEIAKIFLNKTDYKIINEEAKIDINEDEVKGAKVFIIQLEFIVSKEGRKNYIDLYGIDIAEKFRKNGIKAPIIFTSFSELDEIKTDIPLLLEPTSHDFIKFPFTYQEFEEKCKKLKELTDVKLVDVKNHLAVSDATLKDKIHDLKNKSLSGELEGLDVYNELKDVVPGSKSEILEKIKSESSIKYDDLNILEKELTKKIGEDGHISVREPGGKWKLLIVDDDESVLNKLDEAFKKFKINVEKAKNGDNALNIIQNDRINEITVVLVDYRLKGSDGKWLDKQGYDIIYEIMHNSTNLVSFFGLSAISPEVLIEMQNKYGFKVHTFPKSFLDTEDGLRYIANEIIEKGDSVYESIINIPRAKNWKNLKKWYKIYRNHENYNEWEEEISYRAFSVINNIKNMEGEKISDIFKGVQAKLDNNDMENMEIFRKKLLARRVLVTAEVIEKISWQIDNEKYRGTMIERLLTRKNGKKYNKKKLYNDLALTEEDISEARILVEEKRFLKEKLNIDIDVLSQEALDLLIKLCNAALEVLENKEYNITDEKRIIENLKSQDPEYIEILKKILNEKYKNRFSILKESQLKKFLFD